MSNKKVVFSEEVDDYQNGQAVGLAFLAVGLILQFLPMFFGNEKRLQGKQKLRIA